MSVRLRPKNMRGRRSEACEDGGGKRGRKRVNSQTGTNHWATLIHTSTGVKKLAKKNRVMGWDVCEDNAYVFVSESAAATILSAQFNSLCLFGSVESEE